MRSGGFFEDSPDALGYHRPKMSLSGDRFTLVLRVFSAACASLLAGCAGLSVNDMRHSTTCHAWDDDANVKIKALGGVAYDTGQESRPVAMLSKDGIVAIGQPNYVIAQFAAPDVLSLHALFGVGKLDLRLLGDRTESFARHGTQKVNYSPQCAPLDAAIASAGVIHSLQTRLPDPWYVPQMPPPAHQPPPMDPAVTMPPPPAP